MQSVPVHELRAQWSRFVDGADFDGDVFGVMRHGAIEAVLLPVTLWHTGCRRVFVGEDMRQTLTVGEARRQVRELREGAAAGLHTVLVRYGREVAVMAPYSWAVSAALVPPPTLTG
ncbi:hypothetical protein [Nocardia sp. NPDC004722]